MRGSQSVAQGRHQHDNLCVCSTACVKQSHPLMMSIDRQPARNRWCEVVVLKGNIRWDGPYQLLYPVYGTTLEPHFTERYRQTPTTDRYSTGLSIISHELACTACTVLYTRSKRTPPIGYCTGVRHCTVLGTKCFADFDSQSTRSTTVASASKRCTVHQQPCDGRSCER